MGIFYIFEWWGTEISKGKKPLQKSILLVFINQACNFWKGVNYQSITGTCGFKHNKSGIKAILINNTNNGKVGT